MRNAGAACQVLVRFNAIAARVNSTVTFANQRSRNRCPSRLELVTSSAHAYNLIFNSSAG